MNRCNIRSEFEVFDPGEKFIRELEGKLNRFFDQWLDEEGENVQDIYNGHYPLLDGQAADFDFMAHKLTDNLSEQESDELVESYESDFRVIIEFVRKELEEHLDAKAFSCILEYEYLTEGESSRDVDRWHIDNTDSKVFQVFIAFGDIARIECVRGDFDAACDEEGYPKYMEDYEVVELMQSVENPNVSAVPNGRFAVMKDNCIHRRGPVVKDGWRTSISFHLTKNNPDA